MPAPAAARDLARGASTAARGDRRGVARGIASADRDGRGRADAMPGLVDHSARTASPAPVHGAARGRRGPGRRCRCRPGANARRPRPAPAHAPASAQDVVQHARRGDLGAGAGPGDDERVGLVARRGEHELVVRALDAPRADSPVGTARKPDRDLRRRARAPRTAARTPSARAVLRPRARQPRRAPPAARGTRASGSAARPLGHQRLDRDASTSSPG